ncbi:MAG: response regulator [Anaerolineales bacterium]|jgi:NarL family two-component system response regulator LiaR
MSKPDQKIRLLLVDDHTVVRLGLATLLSASKYHIKVIGEAGDGQAAVELAHTLNPDVILMDLFMPGMNGIEAIRQIRRENQQVRILVLTSSGDEEQVLQALRSGANGYLMKDASPDELVNALHSVYYGQLAIPHDLAQKVILHDAGPAPEPEVDPLTDREREVIGCIGRGLSNKQIAAELNIGTTTVRTHVSNILRKLKLENRTQIALYDRDHTA